MRPDHILLAVTGMSPPIITETVWALAHEEPPVIPLRVVVITTQAGADAVARELFTPAKHGASDTIWERIRQQLKAEGHDVSGRLQFGTTGDDLRVFTVPDPDSGQSRQLTDIRSPAENHAAADFLLDQLRQFTENPDLTIIASIAGGRKTMSALLYAGLCLLGRAHDRVAHVLVNEPFDSITLDPKFYFPAYPPIEHALKDRAGNIISRHSSRLAELQMADIPFVRLRSLFPAHLGRYPGRFSRLVEICAERVDDLSKPPGIRLLGGDDPSLGVDEHPPIRLTQREFILYAFLAERCRTGQEAYPTQKEALDDLTRWLRCQAEENSPFSPQRIAAEAWAQPASEDVRKLLCLLRKKLHLAGLSRLDSWLLPQRGRFGIRACVNTPTA